MIRASFTRTHVFKLAFNNYLVSLSAKEILCFDSGDVGIGDVGSHGFAFIDPPVLADFGFIDPPEFTPAIFISTILQ